MMVMRRQVEDVQWVVRMQGTRAMLLMHISLCTAQKDMGNQFCEYTYKSATIEQFRFSNPHPSKILEAAMNAHVRLLRKMNKSCHLYQDHAKPKMEGIMLK
ncbi:hypothetical protein WUBG_04206 [Wuchereria bancrofti]|uniref:Uncharacterized protein n=1 Tax=Wuchereria bancrofti TaxID=6293 RepID=J9ERR7_WUCBA|nr:hypothetical protein WUBG_04206 [Wuchereria bancrofti]